MSKRVMLTQNDKELLQRIDRAVRREPQRDSNRNCREGFAALLAVAVPEADPTFERQLEARLVDGVQSRQGAGARQETVALAHAAQAPWPAKQSRG